MVPVNVGKAMLIGISPAISQAMKTRTIDSPWYTRIIGRPINVSRSVMGIGGIVALEGASDIILAFGIAWIYWHRARLPLALEGAALCQSEIVTLHCAQFFDRCINRSKVPVVFNLEGRCIALKRAGCCEEGEIFQNRVSTTAIVWEKID